MRKKLIVTIFYCAGMGLLHAQQNSWHWGVINCPLNNEDSTFIASVEAKMRHEVLDNNTIMLYTGFTGGVGYRVRIVKAEAKERFQDTELKETKFASAAELVSLWNSAADTCMIVSFQQMIESGLHGGYLSCIAHAPLYYYYNFLEQWEMQRLRELIINSWMKSMNATRNGDTLFRIVRFRNDSDIYLPQASWSHLEWWLENGMWSGSIKPFSNPSLSKPLTKGEIESSLVQWDSTNQVEDPNNPGTFILAPMKLEAFESGIVLYERWVRDDTVTGSKPAMIWNPGTFMYYHREVIAYGIEYAYRIFDPTRFIIWHSADDVKKYLNPAIFGWSPYEESFRAERFETMHIALEP